MYLHLDPVGGVAGDMCAAALLDLRPDLEPELLDALSAAGLDRLVTVRRLDHRDGHALTGSRFEVTAREPETHPHRRFATIRQLLADAALGAAARERALAIFSVLAEAEGRVHGIAPESVTFHEVGAWDSIADIVSVAWLLERLGVSGCSCAPLPAGAGQVDSAHGRLPLPAPATALLLRDCPLYQDGLQGERITPTGAAILRQLRPTFVTRTPARRLLGSGNGFGLKTFPGISNVLRVLAYADEVFGRPPPPGDRPGAAGGSDENVATDADRVLVCRFEVDDQTPEDLAVGLQRLRECEGVLDVLQIPAFGKKGRLAVQVQVLARPDARRPVIAACLAQTSTLGVRWQLVERRVLRREQREVAAGDAGGTGAAPVRVKRTRRPGGSVTVKADIDDLAAAGDRAARERLRRRCEDDPDLAG